MPIFPLDQVRNAVIDRRLEPLLEAVRDDVATSTSGPGTTDGDTVDLLATFDASRARLNVIVAMLADLVSKPGADISTGLGFLPLILRRCGHDVIVTEREPGVVRFAHVPGNVLPYTIGTMPPPITKGSLDFLVFGEVLEHLNLSPVRVLSELAPLLRAGGRLIVSTPNVARLQHIQALIAGENFLEPFDETVPAGRPATDFIEHVREYSVREVADAVEAAGLGIEEVVMTGWGESGYAPLSNPYANEIIVLRASK